MLTNPNFIHPTLQVAMPEAVTHFRSIYLDNEPTRPKLVVTVFVYGSPAALAGGASQVHAVSYNLYADENFQVPDEAGEMQDVLVGGQPVNMLTFIDPATGWYRTDIDLAALDSFLLADTENWNGWQLA